MNGADTMNEITLSEDPRALGIGHLEQFFGPWSIYEPAANGLLATFQNLNLATHVAAAGERKRRNEGGFDMTDDGVAVIALRGTMTKFGSSMTGPGTVETRRQVRAAMRDEAVRSIVLHIDSPGGTVAGTRDLAADVAAAAAVKPVIAFIEDLGASAAYWVASQAGKVYANATALVGSIGAFAVVQDLSGAAGQMGVKVHVIRAGEFKGMGTPGTEVTEKQLAEFQRIIGELNGHFLEAVAAGRRMDRAAVEALADGRVHVGAAALKLKLVDGIKSFDEVLGEGARATKRMVRAEDVNTPAGATIAAEDEQEDETMSDGKVTAPATATPAGPASYAELKTGLPGADAEFVCKQLEAGATLAQAQAAWMTEQNARLAAARTEAETAKAAAKKPGVEALGGGGAKGAGAAGAAAEGDPVAAYEAAVAAKCAQGMTRQRAALAVAQGQPELREAYVAAYNAQRGREAK